jgi:protein pelota
MKAEYCEMQRSFGEIRLFPESVDDLWHLSHLVAPGDAVFATTLRTVDSAQDKLRPEKLEKRPVRLGIRVERVELHTFSNRLRLSGTIEHGMDSGAYHTLNIEPGYEISVIKRWRPHDLERIDRAVKASIHEVVHILTVEEGEAELFRMRQYGPEGVVTITMGSGKGGDTDTRPAFFARIADQLIELKGPLVVSGPGFIKDDFSRFLRSHLPPVAEKMLVVETRRIGAGAVQEVIGLGILEKIHEDVQLGREVRAMDELLMRISKDLPAAYGRGEVLKAIDYGAVEEVLVADSLLRDEGIVHLLDRAELQNARIVVLSSVFDPGKRLEALGGVAALLRYRIQ